MRVWLVLALLFILVGCTGSLNNPGTVDFRTGSQALDMRIIYGANQEVYEGDDLSILVEMRNRGTADISSGLLVVKGYDPQYLPSLRIDPSPVFTIAGKDEFDPNGELSQTFEIQNARVRAPTFNEILPQELNIVACYPYVTEGSYEVCIDPDPTNRRIDNKVCNFNEVSPGAQGHPIAVTNIEQKVSRTDIRFNLFISHVGDGTVYNRRLSTELCAYDLQRQDLNQFDVVRVSFSGNTLRCEPQNPVRIPDSGTALVSCVCENCVDIAQGAYKTALNVELAYGYRNDLQTQIRIIK